MSGADENRQEPTAGVLQDRKRRFIAGAVAGAGAALAIGGMELLSVAMNYPLAVIPFATSIVLVISSPEALPAQPRALIGGHVVSALAGLLVLQVLGSNPWTAAVAVGLGVLAMFVTRTLHPPAGINPLLVVSAKLPWTFVIAPVLAGALLLAAFAYVWHRWVRRQPWPESWS